MKSSTSTFRTEQKHTTVTILNSHFSHCIALSTRRKTHFIQRRLKLNTSNKHKLLGVLQNALFQSKKKLKRSTSACAPCTESCFLHCQVTLEGNVSCFLTHCTTIEVTYILSIIFIIIWQRCLRFPSCLFMTVTQGSVSLLIRYDQNIEMYFLCRTLCS